MPNDSNEETIIDSPTNENESEETEQSEDTESEADGTSEAKPKETPEAKLARLDRQASQLRKKLGVKEDKPRVRQEDKSSDLDYGQKAFLIASGIKGGKEFDLVQEVMTQTGKSLDEVVESRFFQAELKEMREDDSTRQATPTGSKRSSTSARDSVDYWLAKDELPSEDQFELRRKVVNARIKRETSDNPFGSSKIIIK